MGERSNPADSKSADESPSYVQIVLHLNFLIRKTKMIGYCEICGKEILEDWRKDKDTRKTPLRFCSRSCANTRHHSEETKLKIGENCKEKFKSWKETHKEEWNEAYKKSQEKRKINY